MGKSVPTIQKYMTTSPHSIGSDQTLITAEKMMTKYGIRHLPVLEGGNLKGIITDRDIKFLKGFESMDPKSVKLSDISINEVFTVEPHSLLDEVCDVMAENKYGSAIVMDNNKLVGIFTWVDALRAMSELLKTRLTH